MDTKMIAETGRGSGVEGRDRGGVWWGLWSVVLLTMAGDYLFWPAPPGVSFGIFGGLTVVALAVNRGWRRWTWLAMVAVGLLLASVVQSGIALSLGNVLVVGALLLVLVGETSYPALRAGWARWGEALWGMMQAPARWVGFSRVLREVRWTADAGVVGMVFQVALPAVVIGGVFAGLLGAGNAVFAQGLTTLLEQVWEWVPSVEFSFQRLGLWLVLATFALGLVWPGEVPQQERAWAKRIPTLQEPRQVGVAHWRGVTLLVILNGLFFAVNTIDVVYLWMGGAPPEGISPSEYLHEGVNSLIAAVVLAGVVLMVLFQQAAVVTRSRVLQGLSLMWIAQNGALIGSVFLRLKLYVDAYQLSEQRVYVGMFLLLVTVGFGLLAGHVVRPGNLNRLLAGNGVSTFVLFYVVQFLNVPGWVAQENVRLWEADSKRKLDVAYLESLGLAAGPALVRVAETPDRPEAHPAFLAVRRLQKVEVTYQAMRDWRSWQWRREEEGRKLVQHEVRTREERMGAE